MKCNGGMVFHYVTVCAMHHACKHGSRSISFFFKRFFFYKEVEKNFSHSSNMYSFKFNYNITELKCITIKLNFNIARIGECFYRSNIKKTKSTILQKMIGITELGFLKLQNFQLIETIFGFCFCILLEWLKKREETLSGRAQWLKRNSHTHTKSTNKRFIDFNSNCFYK